MLRSLGTGTLPLSGLLAGVTIRRDGMPSPVSWVGGHARRFRVLASFWLRSDAHVLKYCPWAAPKGAWSSPKPRQSPNLASGHLLSVWRGTACSNIAHCDTGE